MITEIINKMNIIDYRIFITTLSLIIFIILWFILLIKGAQDATSKIANFYMFNLILWCFGVVMFYRVSSLHSILFWARFQYCFATLIPISLILYSLNFPSKYYKIPIVKTILTFIPFFIFFPLYFFTPLMIERAIITQEKIKGWIYGPLQIYWDFSFYILCLFVLLILFKKYKKSSEMIKEGIKFVILGNIVGISVSGTLSIILPRLNIFNYLWLSPSLLFAWMLYLIYAIYKNKPIAIKMYIRNSIYYLSFIALIIILYFITLLIVKNVTHNTYVYSASIVAVSFFSSLLILFIPLRNSLQSFIDRYVFSGNYFKILQENIGLREDIVENEKLINLFNRIVFEAKNPLTTLKGYSQFLPQKINDKEFLLTFSNILNDEIKRIKKLVNHLADYSKPSPFIIKKKDILKLLNDTLNIAKDSLNFSNIEIIKIFSIENKTQIYIDIGHFIQALLNILTNSVESMPSGGKLFINTEQTHDEFKIVIADTGCGISEENINTIFDPFFSTKEGHPGLGLSITHSILENLKGKIEVSSEKNVGSEFTITLPIKHF